MKERFDVYGMTCAACQAAVEKSVSKINGVKEVNVSLLTNSMSVDLDGDVTSQEIISAVEVAGYSAKLKSKKESSEKISPKKIIEDEIKHMSNRLKISIPLMILLMYVAMGTMLKLPYPKFLSGVENAGVQVFLQLLLTLPVIYVNRAYYINGFKALFNKNPNMDSLVALGSFAGLVYGVFAAFMIFYNLGHGNKEMVHHYMHDLYFETSAMILTLITLGKFLEAKSKKKTTDSINRLIDIQPDFVTLIKEGEEENVPVEDIVKGDHIKIKPGERIAIDGRLVSGYSSLDQSAITGESIPVEVNVGDRVISGSINQNGSFVMEATNVGDDTTINKIIQLIEEASATKAPISKLADKISSIFVPVVISLSILAYIVWMALGKGFEFSFSIAIGILVISCPCALGLATPVAMMVATGKAADNGIIVKNSEALEQLHKSKTMIFDKTGTITQGKPRLTDIVSLAGLNQNEIMEIAYALEDKSQQPLASAIVEYAKDNAINLKEVELFEAITGKGIKAKLDDKMYYIGNAKLMKDLGIYQKAYEDKADTFSQEGKTSIYLFDESRVIAILAVADQIKESSIETIKSIRAKGIKTVMLTGDNKLTAFAMAEKTGIDEFRAELLPQDKDQIVSEYKNSGIVTMVGDGINDAPALIRADVGIGIASGTDVAIDSADLVLMKSDLHDIVNAINLSEKTIKNIKQNLFWAFFYNVLAIPLAMGLFYIPFGMKLNPMIGALAMSFSSVFVVTNALRLKNFKPVNSVNKAEDDVVKELNFQVYNINNNLIENKGEVKMKNTILVDGMTCNHCKMRVEKACLAVEGVKDVEVSLEDKKVEFEAEPSKIASVKMAISQAGYEVIS